MMFDWAIVTITMLCLENTGVGSAKLGAVSTWDGKSGTKWRIDQAQIFYIRPI